MNPRILPPRRIILTSLTGTALPASQELGLIIISAIIKLERVDNERLITITVPRAIVSSARRQVNLSLGKRLTTVRSAMHLILPRPIRTWMDIYPNEMLL